ncbi:hypothetical protein BST83_10685 [Polaribacter filamentus]|jgi:hypothetical protein|uniref:Uncharacterized protein n=1 Tax=Polaribacter filamentus TaxID=53483 RepID=A0A2S7KYI7_9FLAO|nr:hypothetical protein BST83_10685 [Polaribacter filamentus]
MEKRGEKGIKNLKNISYNNFEKFNCFLDNDFHCFQLNFQWYSSFNFIKNHQKRQEHTNKGNPQ